MKIILVPTDFSLTADNALNYAMPIATKENAKIVVVHAYKIDPMYNRMAFPTYFIEDEIAHAERRANHHLNATCEWIKKEHNIQCEYISMLGTPADVIQKTSKKLKPFLIVMGTNGASGLSERILGSTTAQIIGTANFPVFAIPASAKYHSIEKIAFALDFNQKHMDTIKQIKELNTLFQAYISVIHVCDGYDPDDDKWKQQQFKKNAEKKLEANISYRFINNSNINEELLKLAKNKRYDILVMSTHKRSFFESLFNSSKTKKISNSIHIPLLAFNSKKG